MPGEAYCLNVKRECQQFEVAPGFGSSSGDKIEDTLVSDSNDKCLVLADGIHVIGRIGHGYVGEPHLLRI